MQLPAHVVKVRAGHDVLASQVTDVTTHRARADRQHGHPDPTALHRSAARGRSAQHRRKSDSTVVELVKTERVKNKFGDGEKWLLSDGTLIGGMDLMLKSEFVGRAQASA